MAILRCAHCQFLKEVANQHIGKITKCPNCQKPAKVVDTLQLVNAAVSQFLKLSQEYKLFKQNHAEIQTKLTELVNKHVQLNREKSKLQKQLEHLHETSKGDNSIELPDDFYSGYAFENQAHAESLNNFQPIIDWLKSRNIKVTPNTKASDISGYFDEIAVMLGDNLTVLTELLEGIRYRQRKGYDKFTLHLENYDKNSVKLLKEFCQMAYEFAFFSKYHFSKEKYSIFLTLNQSPQIQNFFNGEWLEWYAFMKVASFLTVKKQKFSCLRSSQITFVSDNTYNEIDMFFLVGANNQPLWIECKTGEFRDSINKYQELRKRLNINPKYSILLVSGLEDDKAAAMSLTRLLYIYLNVCNNKQVN